jgi:hypothetical protein
MIDTTIPFTFQLFMCGFAGSGLVEVVAILRYYNKPGRFPVRYSKKGFWATRTVLALGGGFFAFLYNPLNLLLAAHIGASTPLLVAALTESLPDDGKRT